MVASGLAHIFDIGRTEAFLAGSRSCEFQGYFPQEFLLKLDHSGTGKKQGRIVRRYKGPAGLYCMILPFKKIQKAITKLISGHIFCPLTHCSTDFCAAKSSFDTRRMAIRFNWGHDEASCPRLTHQSIT
jgi:hypothetical protein